MKKRLLIFFSILVLSLPIAIKNVKAQTTQEQLDMINEVCQLLISTGLDSNECKAFLQEYNCEDKSCYKFKLMQLEEIDDCETYECYYSKACEIDGVKEYLNDCNITKRKEYAKNLCAELKKVHDKASDAAIAAGRDPQTASKQRAAADANCITMLEESAGCKDEKCFRRVICEEVTPFADYIDFCAEFKDKQSDEDKKYEEKYNVANCYGFGDTVYYVKTANPSQRGDVKADKAGAYKFNMPDYAITLYVTFKQTTYHKLNSFVVGQGSGVRFVADTVADL